METVGVESEFEPCAEPGGFSAWASDMLELLDGYRGKCSSQTASEVLSPPAAFVSSDV